MPNCGALGCKNRSSNFPEKSFHRLPSLLAKKDLRDKWIANINRKHTPKEMYVCSDHFEKECFSRDLRAELLGEKPRRLLIEGSVPTIFQHNVKKHNKCRIASILREEKRVRKEALDRAMSSSSEMLSGAANIYKMEAELQIQNVVMQVDKAINNIPKKSNRRTKSNITGKPKKVPLIVKIPPVRRKKKNMGVNTDLSFKPFEVVKMTIESSESTLK